MRSGSCMRAGLCVEPMLGLVLALSGSLAVAQPPTLWQGLGESISSRQLDEVASWDAVGATAADGEPIDTAADAAAASRGSWWYVARPRVWVRAMADERAYPTSGLSLGAAVEVYSTTTNGWAAIRPPEGAFDWVPADALYLQAGGRQGQSREAGTTAWIGSLLGTPHRYQSQIDLAAGQPVTVIDQMSVRRADGKEQVWLAISPPPGEFRWVRLADLSRQPPGAVGTGSVGTGSVGTGSVGTGSVGTGSVGTGATVSGGGVSLASSQSFPPESSRLSEGLIMSDYFLLESLEEPLVGEWSDELPLTGGAWGGESDRGQTGGWISHSEPQLQQLIEHGRLAPPGGSGGRIDRHQPLGRWGASVGGAPPPDMADDPQWDSWSWLGEKQQFRQPAAESQPVPGILGIIGFRTLRPEADPWHHALPGHPDVQSHNAWDQKQRAHQAHRERPPGLLDGGWPAGSPVAWLWPIPQPVAAPLSQLEHLPRPTPRSRRPSVGDRGERNGSGAAKGSRRDDLLFDPSQGASEESRQLTPEAPALETQPQVSDQDSAAREAVTDSRDSRRTASPTQVGWHAIAGPLPEGGSALASNTLSAVTASHTSEALRVSTPQAQQLLADIERSLAGPTAALSWETLWQSANALVESDAGPLVRGEGRLLRQHVEQLQQRQQWRSSPGIGSAGWPVAAPATSRVPASPVTATMGQSGSGSGGSGSGTSDWLTQPPTVDPSGIQASDASGWLVAVHSDNPNQPPFALTDAAGQLICYLQPMPGANLRRYLRQPVAVYGRRGYLPQLDAKLVTVDRIVRLQP